MRMKIKRFLKKLNNKGMTLTEMLVAFALLALFLVSVTEVISYTVSIYYNARNTTYGMEVATIIKNEIGKELYNSKGNPKVIPAGSSGSGMCEIEYENADQTLVKLKVDQGLLKISYPDNSMYEATDWYLGSKTYMNYRITDFVACDANSLGTGVYDSNIMYVSITVHNDLNGFDYTSEGYIRCYNADNIE